MIANVASSQQDASSTSQPNSIKGVDLEKIAEEVVPITEVEEQMKDMAIQDNPADKGKTSNHRKCDTRKVKLIRRESTTKEEERV